MTYTLKSDAGFIVRIDRIEGSTIYLLNLQTGEVFPCDLERFNQEYVRNK